jgi:hypothetical protein
VGDSPWNSYNTDSDLDPAPKGGIMLTKENENNSQGRLFDPSDNSTAVTYQAESELCWGCHPDGMDFRGDDSTTASSDSVEWEGTWDKSAYTYKDGNFRSSHFYPNRQAATPYDHWGNDGDPSGITRTNLTCSTCHDPHGVKTTATYPDYRVPILRGTWLTSPYLEDAVPTAYQTSQTYWDWREAGQDKTPTGEVLGARIAPERTHNRVDTIGWGYANESGNSGVPGYYIDDNTFGLYGGNSSLASGQMVGVWGSSSTNQTSSNQAARMPIYVKHMDSVATSPGGTQTSNVTATDGVTNMTVGSGLSTNRISGLCEACHLFDDTTGAGDLGNFTGHKTVVGLDSRSAWNTSWTKMFTRPYMHMKHRALINDPNNDGAEDFVDCTRGTPFDKPGNHDGACGYRWGVDPHPNRSAQSNYHKFSCSKCHTPHASRLPRLMVTNCLDIGSGTGDGASIDHSSYTYPWVNDDDMKGNFDNMNDFFDRWWSSQGPSNSAAAQDIAITCHAATDGASIFNDGSSTPWNDVTPW